MLHDDPLADIVDDLRFGRIGPHQYVERLESRATECEPRMEALVAESDRWARLRRTATELAERYSDSADRPPLYGVPVGVKDVFRVDGLPTRAGSALSPDVLAGEEATAVGRLRDAGAAVLGKTVTAEFACFEPGPTRNPHDTDHTPGGSSSGSAAAVAAGVCPAALGTQTVGSITRPAAFCGVVGVKPSFGRVPTDGVVPVSRSLDHVGFFTQDVAGARLVAAVLCEDWRVYPTPRDRPTLGVPDGPYLAQASDAGLAAFEDHVDRLAAAGYEIQRVDVLDDVDAINDRHERLMRAEMAIAHEEWYREHAEKYAESTRELVEEGRAVTSAAIARGRQSRGDLRESLEARMAETGVDLWITPAAPGPAPEGIDSTGDPVMNLPWTHAGLPSVSLPAGETDAGLPLGLQCIAQFRADEALLAWTEGMAAEL